ncbi:hypothetical protein R84B8_02212 [Treponema sp. R8-4-B8]
MISKYIYLKILVILVFGFLNVGLVNAQTDDLSGVWTTTISNITQVSKQMEITFNDGNFEVKLDGIFFSKGTYSAAGGIYKMQTTVFYGTTFKLDSKWYTQEQLRAALKASFSKMMTVEKFNEIIDRMYSLDTGTYSVKDNVLTMKRDNETQSLTYTKK